MGFKKKALITGIMGQDGFYLAHLLLREGYDVFGLDLPKYITSGKADFDPKINLISTSLLELNSLEKIFKEARPDEVYNLASQSSTGISFREPDNTFQINALGLFNLIEVIRTRNPNTRLFQASSADMFGDCDGIKNEETPLNPGSPYAASKAAAHFLVKSYRESYKLFFVNGIMFPHESPRRSENFVTRKITRTAAKIKLGRSDTLLLGDIKIKRDWGYAGDYVRAMYKSLNVEKPGDYVLSTGRVYSIAEVLEFAFSYLDLDWKKYVRQDEALVRIVEIRTLVGDSTKARKVLGWEPVRSFKETIEEMVKVDYEELKNKI